MSQTVTLAIALNIPEGDENLGEQPSLNVDATTGLLGLYHEEVVSYLNVCIVFQGNTHIFGGHKCHLLTLKRHMTLHIVTLWKCVEEFKIPTKLINMCRTCTKTKSAVRIEGTLSSFF